MNYKNITIRNLQSHEWALLKSLRIAALETDAQSFWDDIKDVKCFDDVYWQNLAAELTSDNGSRMFLLEANSKNLGFVYGIRREDEEYRIGGLWIDNSQRQHGYGSLLVQHVIAWAKSYSPNPSIKLWSPVGTTVSFYERNGFKSLYNFKNHALDERKIVEMVFCDTPILFQPEKGQNICK